MSEMPAFFKLSTRVSVHCITLPLLRGLGWGPSGNTNTTTVEIYVRHYISIAKALWISTRQDDVSSWPFQRSLTTGVLENDVASIHLDWQGLGCSKPVALLLAACRVYRIWGLYLGSFADTEHLCTTSRASPLSGGPAILHCYLLWVTDFSGLSTLYTVGLHSDSYE